jgi:organic hydroperoxide reductase OsmC/OhrA
VPRWEHIPEAPSASLRCASEWWTNRLAELSTADLLALRTAPPVGYDGPRDAWSPEHLLLASVQACFLFTLRAIARTSKVELTSLELAGRKDMSRVRVAVSPLRLESTVTEA